MLFIVHGHGEYNFHLKNCAMAGRPCLTAFNNKAYGSIC